MKDLISLGLRREDSKLFILDQQQLPTHEVWIEITSPHDMIGAIKKLKIRGAPLIGVAAVLSLAQFACEGALESEWRFAAEQLKLARPTAVNLMACIERMLKIEGAYDLSNINHLAEVIFNEDVELCKRIGENGAELINHGDQILTHCNTGGLATAGIGTALGVIQMAHEQGKNIHVFVDETRPLLQGSRLTAWELEKLGIPYTLICDNMAAHLMRDKKITKAIVGADRIALNGDFANKVGTYSVAVNCDHHGVPFYVAAPYTTLDKSCLSGIEIPIENRDPREVRGLHGAAGNICWSPENSKVYNPAFDVTPFDLVTGWIFDNKVVSPTEVHAGQLKEL